MTDDISIIGEVIEASTSEFAAESRTLHAPPSFGSFVKVLLAQGEIEHPTSNKVEDKVMDDPFDESICTLQPAVYAIVHQASTGPVDSSRRLRAYWKDEQELNDEQPELAEWLLVTDFHATIIGHSCSSGVRQFLPPQPPKLHAFVYPCMPEEIRVITSRMDFLRTLSNSQTAQSEEIIAACIREAYAASGGNFNFLVAAGKELASLLKDDYDRLHAIMRRVAP